MILHHMQDYAEALLRIPISVWQGKPDSFGNVTTYVDEVLRPARVCSGSVAECLSYLKAVRRGLHGWTPDQYNNIPQE